MRRGPRGKFHLGYRPLFHEEGILHCSPCIRHNHVLPWLRMWRFCIMANHETHRRAGRVAGAVYAAHRAKEQGVVHCAVEMAGGVFGGEFGARVADLWSPDSSWHRGTAHSCATGVAILSLGDVLTQVETFCRQQAEQKAAQRRTLQMSLDLAQPDLVVPALTVRLHDYSLPSSNSSGEPWVGL